MSLSAAEFRAELAAAIPRVKDYAFRLTRNSDEAEELIQATALHVLEREDGYTHLGRFGGYLASTMLFVFLNRRHKALRHPWEDLDRYADELVAESAADVSLELKRVIAWADSGLSAGQRQAVLLDVTGNSNDEIAEKLGCQVGTVKSRLNRAHVALRARFQEI